MSQGVFVTVQDKFGDPLANVYVSASGYGISWHAYTNDSGTCIMDTYAGTFLVYTRRYGLVQNSQYVTVPSGYYTNLYFTPVTGYEMHASIEGILHNENDVLVGDIMVWGIGILGTTKYWGCLTKSNGEYRLPIHSAGTYNIVCGKTNYDMVSIGDYTQVSTAPISTTTKNFTGTYKATRITIDDPMLCVDGRSMVIRDTLDGNYNYQSDSPTNSVYTKVRKWNGSLLNTYLNYTDDTLVRDGYGGSQYY